MAVNKYIILYLSPGKQPTPRYLVMRRTVWVVPPVATRTATFNLTFDLTHQISRTPSSADRSSCWPQRSVSSWQRWSWTTGLPTGILWGAGPCSPSLATRTPKTGSVRCCCVSLKWVIGVGGWRICTKCRDVKGRDTVRFVTGCRRLAGTCYLHRVPWRWRKIVATKRRYPYAKPYNNRSTHYGSFSMLAINFGS